MRVKYSSIFFPLIYRLLPSSTSPAGPLQARQAARPRREDL